MNFLKTLVIGLIAGFSLNTYAADVCTAIVAKATATITEKSVGCDGGASKVESVIKTAPKPAAKHVKTKPVVETTDSSAMKALAEENLRLKADLAAGGVRTKVELNASPAQFPSMPRYPVEGKVYSDSDGNTFERHLGGARECKFYVNGRLEKSVFAPVDLDKVASKQYCDLQAAEFYATKTPTTPEASSTTPVVYQAPVSATTTVAANTAPSVSASTGGTVICNFKVDNKVVKTINTDTTEACQAWTKKEAKERGLIPAN